MNDTVLSLRNIYKRFGQSSIINDLSIDVYRGEFVTLLGESGCGKTTTLRLVAGLEQPDSGIIVLDGIDVAEMPPNKRDVNTVFQNYALFPHMNVYDNIGYGPKIRKLSKHELKREINETLALVKMTGYEKRMPHQLSGGQRQRVAIARALINKPLILLLDEPLGALDQKLRKHMQAELKSIQAQAGVTFVYVTHDQDEALNMSNRVGVMRNGRFLQIGTPPEIYEEPKDLFVAGFVGERSILPVIIAKHTDNHTTAEVCGHKILAKRNTALLERSAAHAAILSDRVLITEEQGSVHANIIAAKVLSAEYSGTHVKTVLMLFGEHPFAVIEYGGTIRPRGMPVNIAIKPEDAILL